MSLEGKVAVITGAGQGIGRGIALRLGSEGADIGVVDKNLQTAAAVAEEIKRLGRRALLISADISLCSQIPLLVERVIQEFGGVDIWVNNAAIVYTTGMLEVTEDEWDSVMAVNAKGTFFCTQAIAKHMVQRGSGLIVNLTSGQRARPMAATYAASKMALDNITQTAALALAPHKVRVNAIDPGMVRTPMWEQLDSDRVRLFGLPPGEARRRWESQIPIGRITTVEQVGGVVAFLASDDAANVTGQIIRLTGGTDLATFERAHEAARKS
jgi:NAD(P)-dependent dehydrogenase (short-subunit alcohol dehydrogenase family)